MSNTHEAETSFYSHWAASTKRHFRVVVALGLAAVLSSVEMTVQMGFISEGIAFDRAFRWCVIFLSLIFAYGSHKSLFDEKRLSLLMLSVVMVLSVCWVQQRTVDEDISLLKALDYSWLRGCIPVGALILGGNYLGGIFVMPVVGLWLYAFVNSPAEDNISSLNNRIILTDHLVLLVLVFYKNIFTNQAYNHAADARQIAEAANKTKTVFMAKMSHDLRTPLNGLLGYIEEIMDTKMTKEQNHILEVIQLCAKNLERLIVDLLDVSLIEMGKIKLVYQNFPVEKDLQSLGHLALAMAQREKKALHFHVQPSMQFVAQGDPVRVQQILINLINNAIKFTQADGKIHVHLYLGTSADSSKHRVEFSVADNGIGIPHKFIDKVFMPFFQCQNDFVDRGSGLGLYICKQLTSAMGGDIHVVSRENEGTTFTGYFYLDKCDVPDSICAPAFTPQQPNFQAITALIAEDNEVNVRLLTRILDGLGVSYLTACNGQEAVELYKQHAQSISLILMDIQMPVCDGIEAAKRIRSFDTNVPIIACTAGVMESELETIRTAGIDDYISKPIKKDLLKSVLHKYAETKRTGSH